MYASTPRTVTVPALAIRRISRSLDFRSAKWRIDLGGTAALEGEKSRNLLSQTVPFLEYDCESRDFGFRTATNNIVRKKEKVMSKANIIRAWKDEAFRLSLSAEQRAALPANPAGAIELADSQLDEVAGGVITDDPKLCNDTVYRTK